MQLTNVRGRQSPRSSESESTDRCKRYWAGLRRAKLRGCWAQRRSFGAI